MFTQKSVFDINRVTYVHIELNGADPQGCDLSLLQASYDFRL